MDLVLDPVIFIRNFGVKKMHYGLVTHLASDYEHLDIHRMLQCGLR